MLDVFEARFNQLTPKARRMFMEGKITLGQAYKFSTQRREFGKRKLEDLADRHLTHHTELLGHLPYINYPLHSLEDLLNELARHPRAIARAIARGELTLVQARFARERSLGGKRLTDLMAHNAEDRITAPITRPVHKAPRDRITLRRPAARITPRARR